ncbi:MAG: hypothetical protein N3D10_00195 [Candidatus Micrarchaeota archaeon]|nr:hypothetical protein [Candidatus Micrarchaeota archaeon]
MMWLEALFSSLLILSALLLYFQIPSHSQNLADFYLYLLLSDQAYLAINSNLSLFCKLENSNICLRCSLIESDSFSNSTLLNLEKEEFSSASCKALYLGSKPKKVISLTRVFYHEGKLKKLVLSAFFN